jgi:hypothetical protein
VVNLVHKGQKLPVNVILPEKAIKALSNAEYKATTAAKRNAVKQGQQVSKQPRKIAKKTARFR